MSPNEWWLEPPDDGAEVLNALDTAIAALRAKTADDEFWFAWDMEREFGMGPEADNG